jgi:hypothetical protein
MNPDRENLLAWRTVNMKKSVRVPALWFFISLFFASPSTASQCVQCHTDALKLKTITDALPKPEVSAETAGKG